MRRREFRLLSASKRLEAWWRPSVPCQGRRVGPGRGLEDPQTLQRLRGEVSPSQSGGSLFSSCPPRSRTLCPTPGKPLPTPPPPTSYPVLPYKGRGRESRRLQGERLSAGGKAPETPKRHLPPFLASGPGENLPVAGMGGDSRCDNYKMK